MLALLLSMALIWNIRKSPFYPVFLSIRDAERFAEAAGVRTSRIKIGLFGLSAAIAGGAGWLFSFLGVVSPGQFDWSVSLNILVMVLVGGINPTLGPVIGAAFVSMFPALVNINPWLQEMAYGALSILAVTLFPGGVISLVKSRAAGTLDRTRSAARRPRRRGTSGSSFRRKLRARASEVRSFASEWGDAEAGAVVECHGIQFSYGGGTRVLREVNLVVKRGHIHGLSARTGPERAPWPTSSPAGCNPSRERR